MSAEGQRKVLVCVDGSEQAKYAFECYLQKYKQDNDFVYGLTVPEYNFTGVTVGPLSDHDNIQKQFMEQHKVVENLCADFTTDLRQRGIKGQCDSFVGDKPAGVILDQANKLNVDCIIMGTRGLGRLKSLVSGGSVSRDVVSNAQVPVFVIPYPKDK